MRLRVAARRRPRLLLAFAALAVAVVAGGLLAAYVGPGQADDDPLVGPDYYASPSAVCTLLSVEDLELALGVPYEEGLDPGNSSFSFAGVPGMTQCFYPPVGEGYGSVEVGVVYAYAEQVLTEHADELGDRAREVTGVGDRAVWDTQGNELFVLADDKIVAVSIPATSAWYEADLIERSRRLADVAIGRLE